MAYSTLTALTSTRQLAIWAASNFNRAAAEREAQAVAATNPELGQKLQNIIISIDLSLPSYLAATDGGEDEMLEDAEMTFDGIAQQIDAIKAEIEAAIA